MFVPSNIKSFYESLDKNRLWQGDIVRAEKIGIKEASNIYSPDFWMIITKTCDLTLEADFTTRRQIVSCMPLIGLNILKLLYQKDTFQFLQRMRKKIVFLPVFSFLEKFAKMKVDNVESLLKNQISKFMYLPPDGVVLTEPMVIDFDITTQLDGGDPGEVKNIIDAKVLQLTSPFRERIAQRFAEHYATIGIDDDSIKSKEYCKQLKTYLNSSK